MLIIRKGATFRGHPVENSTPSTSSVAHLHVERDPRSASAAVNHLMRQTGFKCHTTGAAFGRKRREQALPAAKIDELFIGVVVRHFSPIESRGV